MRKFTFKTNDFSGLLATGLRLFTAAVQLGEGQQGQDQKEKN